LNQKTPVQIQISSLTGQIIIRKDLGIQSAGHHQWIFEAEGIPSGEYICIVTTLHWKSSRKMILIK
jgi:hypothetical protein